MNPNASLVTAVQKVRELVVSGNANYHQYLPYLDFHLSKLLAFCQHALGLHRRKLPYPFYNYVFSYNHIPF